MHSQKNLPTVLLATKEMEAESEWEFTNLFIKSVQ